MMKHSSCQFGNLFLGFGCQSEKFSRIGTCIRRNFMPCLMGQGVIHFDSQKMHFTVLAQERERSASKEKVELVLHIYLLSRSWCKKEMKSPPKITC